MLTDVPLRTGLTPAVIAGGWINALLSWGSIAALALSGLIVRRQRRARAGDATTPAPVGTGVDSV
jgi:apolipoprotein N-acyltransferase